jgi:hypothetical protein
MTVFRQSEWFAQTSGRRRLSSEGLIDSYMYLLAAPFAIAVYYLLSRRD